MTLIIQRGVNRFQVGEHPFELLRLFRAPLQAKGPDILPSDFHTEIFLEKIIRKYLCFLKALH